MFILNRDIFIGCFSNSYPSKLCVAQETHCAWIHRTITANGQSIENFKCFLFYSNQTFAIWLLLLMMPDAEAPSRSYLFASFFHPIIIYEKYTNNSVYENAVKYLEIIKIFSEGENSR